MAIARERQVFIGLMLVAGTGLMLDRAVLGPRPAEAGIAAGEEPALLADTTTSLRTAIGKASAASIAGMFERFGGNSSDGLNFGPDAAWTEREVAEIITADFSASRDEAEAGQPAPTLTDPVLARIKLSLVMPTQSGGVAVINGARMQLGQWHPDGFQLIHVGERSVVIEIDGKPTTVNLPRTGG